MADDGRAAAEALIDGLDEPRRSQMRHLHEVILTALPGIDVGVWEYSGAPHRLRRLRLLEQQGSGRPLVLDRHRHRKNFISLYAMASSEEATRWSRSATASPA